MEPLTGLKIGDVITYRLEIYYRGRLINKLLELKGGVDEKNVPFYFNKYFIQTKKADLYYPTIIEKEPGVYETRSLTYEPMTSGTIEILAT